MPWRSRTRPEARTGMTAEPKTSTSHDVFRWNSCGALWFRTRPLVLRLNRAVHFSLARLKQRLPHIVQHVVDGRKGHELIETALRDDVSIAEGSIPDFDRAASNNTISGHFTQRANIRNHAVKPDPAPRRTFGRQYAVFQQHDPCGRHATNFCGSTASCELSFSDGVPCQTEVTAQVGHEKQRTAKKHECCHQNSAVLGM